MTKRANRSLCLLIILLNVLGLSSCQTTSDPCAYTPEYISQTQQQAETGDAEAQYEMGVWYTSHCGIDDVKTAFGWYERAADQNHLEAQYRTGTMYFHGVGVSMDIDQGMALYRKAAEQGHKVAARTLGDIYFWGKYVSKDLDKAEKWYGLGMEQGDALSQTRLG